MTATTTQNTGEENKYNAVGSFILSKNNKYYILRIQVKLVPMVLNQKCRGVK